jgi:hypothetical protein
MPSKNGVVKELQRLFIFLTFSQRRMIAPQSFHKVLPSMYRSGYQQDSSEFGK